MTTRIKFELASAGSERSTIHLNNNVKINELKTIIYEIYNKNETRQILKLRRRTSDNDDLSLNQAGVINNSVIKIYNREKK